MDLDGRGINHVLAVVGVSASPQVLSVCAIVHARQSRWISREKEHNWRELQKTA